MLEELVVQNYALIDKATVKFGPGLNVLSGETGAGKSILIGALSLLLGVKGDSGSVRTGTEEAVVSGIIQVEGNPGALDWLSEHGVEPEDGTIIIRRVLKRSGRGSIFVQSVPVTRQDLDSLTSFLFDMHGQHEHQSLLSRDNQRVLLDRYGGTEEEAAAYGSEYQELMARKRRFEKLEASEKSQLREMDILSFAINEIESAGLKPGEEEDLDREKGIVSQHEKLYTHLDEIHQKASESRTGALSLLRDTRSAMENIAAIDGELTPLSKRLEDAFFEVEDVVEELRRYQLAVQFRPDRLEEIEGRLALIHRLEKKYGDTITEVLKFAEESKEQLDTMENWQEDKEKLLKDISERESRVLEMARRLSARRKAAAEELTRLVGEKLDALGMPKSVFEVEVVQQNDDESGPGPHGIDRVEFTISPNKGEPLKPLRTIASGGELSRIMLAIKSVMAETDRISSLIFDEIDTGIGGEVARSVGEHLQSLSRGKQVLCITHLASIAVYADNHLKVEKYIEGERTFTGVTAVSSDERVREIARMLAGDSAGEASLTHAEDLLKRYSPQRA